MTARHRLPAFARQAHAVLDQVVDGRPVSPREIEQALQLLGDLAPFTRRELSLGGLSRQQIHLKTESLSC
jgi:hypothetical protein